MYEAERRYDEERRMYEHVLPSLTIKDKLNYPYLLAMQFITIQKVILNMEFSQREIKEAVLGLVQMIPDSWKDEDWEKDEKEAEIKTEIDHRRFWCGVKMLPELYVKQYGKSPFETILEYNPNKLFHAAVNLLDRRGLITRRAKVEKHLGEKWDGGEKAGDGQE